MGRRYHAKSKELCHKQLIIGIRFSTVLNTGISQVDASRCRSNALCVVADHQNWS